MMAKFLGHQTDTDSSCKHPKARHVRSMKQIGLENCYLYDRLTQIVMAKCLEHQTHTDLFASILDNGYLYDGRTQICKHLKAQMPGAPDSHQLILLASKKLKQIGRDGAGG